MKKILFSKHEVKQGAKQGDRGVALIAVILTITLVTALFVMSFTNGLIGKLVTQTHSQGRAAAQCAQGSFEIANAILVKVASTGTTQGMTADLPDGVTVVINDLGGLTSESRRGNKPLVVGGKPLSADDPKVDPDITVTAGPCTTTVDIDYVLHNKPPGSEINFSAATHDPTGGTACAEGEFYYMTAVTTNGASSRTARSVYFKCPG